MTPYEKVTERYALPFPAYPFQVDEINTLSELPRCGFYWEPGCVDADTEYLTPTGWARIADYAGGKVAQFNEETLTAEFVTPSRFVNLPCDEMIHIHTKYGVDQMLSPEHRVLYGRADRPGPLREATAGSVADAHDSWHAGEPSKGAYFPKLGLPTLYKSRGGAGIPVTDELLRLQVAVIADGSFQGERCTFRLKKPRKVQRLRELLQAAGVDYAERGDQSRTGAGFTVFRFTPWSRAKEFDASFWEASPEQLELIGDEAEYWDGCTRPGHRGPSFSSTSKLSADFIQHCWVHVGRTTRVRADFRDKYSGGVCYSVESRGPSRGGELGLLNLRNRAERTVNRVAAPGGRKYCFTVPTGMLVLRRSGCVFITGNSGKTSGAAVWALYQMLAHGITNSLIVMPPILLYQWQAYLQRIVDRTTGKPLQAEVLAGTPKQRAKVDINAQFLLMSYGILKNDFDRLEAHYSRRRFLGVCDEATAIKNIESGTHKAVHLMFEQAPLALLTGTPINKPGDAYGYMRLVSPHLYRNHRHFLRTHVGAEDDYGNVETWVNLDLLAQNMRVHTSRIIRRQVRNDLPEVIYTPVTYRLDPAHQKLYERIAKERLVEMEGKVIDAISAGKLRSALQQVVVNWGEFDENPDRRPAVLDLIDEVMEEIGDRKLVIAAHFQRTNRYLESQLRQRYGAVAVYGEISPQGKQAAINRFISDPLCRCILVQPSSAGVGVDGLQHVCSDMLIVEAPTTPTPFEQVVKRLDRDGQQDVVNIRIAIAQSTVQVRMFRDLLNNDALANQVQGGYQDLKDAVYGA